MEHDDLVRFFIELAAKTPLPRVRLTLKGGSGDEGFLVAFDATEGPGRFFIFRPKVRPPSNLNYRQEARMDNQRCRDYRLSDVEFAVELMAVD